MQEEAVPGKSAKPAEIHILYLCVCVSYQTGRRGRMSRHETAHATATRSLTVVTPTPSPTIVTATRPALFCPVSDEQVARARRHSGACMGTWRRRVRSGRGRVCGAAMSGGVWFGVGFRV
jgi:hypothetical protein